MKTEYEVRVLEINKDEIIKKLKDLSCEFVGEYVQKRYVYDFKPKLEGKWIRLRTNGKETTLTIKDIITDKIDGTKELEIEVSDFDKTASILEELGYRPKAIQENKRVRYMYKDIEIDIDSWPLIPDYLEIEGNSIEEVNNMIQILGIDEETITTKDCQNIYKDYGYDLDSIQELKLEEERL